MIDLIPYPIIGPNNFIEPLYKRRICRISFHHPIYNMKNLFVQRNLFGSPTN